MHWSKFGDVYFIEGCPEACHAIEPISIELNRMFGQDQLANLDDVKRRMCDRVAAVGGNCVVDFRYGQRSSFWRSLVGLDKVHWYGTGTIGRIDPRLLSPSASQ